MKSVYMFFLCLNLGLMFFNILTGNFILSVVNMLSAMFVYQGLKD